MRFLCVFAVVALAGALKVAEEYPKVDQHVVNGTPARPHQFPWQGGLKINGRHTCGASLISANWVMTAAHCVRGSTSSYSVVLGQHNRLRGEGVRIQVVEKRSHPLYRHDGRLAFPNDIALVRLASPAPIDGRTIVAARLPPTSSTDYVGNECYISGWGRYSTGSGSLATTLLHARVNVLTQTVCRRSISQLGAYHICIKDTANTQGACNGDSGGPLQCNRGGQMEVGGIASFVFGNCMTTRPSGYARVAHFRDWIRQNAGV